MIWEPFLLVLGFLLLIKGSDFLVEAASRIAKKLGVPEFVIGLTLVAVGTSVPELASSVAAALNGYDDLIIGNLVGSNMANIGLIMGISLLFSSLKVDENMLKRDGYIMVGAIVLFYIFALAGVIRWYVGVLFMLLYLAYVMFLIKTKDSGESVQKHHFGSFVEYFFKLEYLITIKNHAVRQIAKRREKPAGQHKKIYEAFKEGLVKDFIIVIISLVAIVYGAEYLVQGAVWLAGLMHISDGLIGLSVVAIGTSLPELSVSVAAARRKYADMAIGNVIGSNIANILLIMGVCTIIKPISVSRSMLSFLCPLTIFMSWLLVALIKKSDHVITRKHGIALISIYMIFMAFLFWMG
jgi:cation:H+ antiporter